MPIAVSCVFGGLKRDEDGAATLQRAARRRMDFTGAVVRFAAGMQRDGSPSQQWSPK